MIFSILNNIYMIYKYNNKLITNKYILCKHVNIYINIYDKAEQKLIKFNDRQIYDILYKHIKYINIYDI